MYLFVLFWIHNMYTFLHKKKNHFLLNTYFICKMYTFDQYFWLEITNTYTTILCNINGFRFSSVTIRLN